MLLKTFYIKTFGCQMNESDSERIASFLEANNFKESKADSSAGALAKADLVVFNTCGVRQTAEDRVYGAVHNLRKANSKCFVIITGCLTHRKDVQRKLKGKVGLFLSIRDLLEFKKLDIENLLDIGNWKLEIPANRNCEGYPYLSTKPKYKNNLKASVPIMTGCNNFCSYCVVPYARGREWSRPVEDIFKEIANLVKNGCKEITLLGQNVNSYHFEFRISNFKSSLNERIFKHFEFNNLKLIKNLKLKIKNSRTITFPILLNLLAIIYPSTHFKFLTSHPKDFSDELIKVIKNNKNISREIHLPVQSGSDKILKLMNRPYVQKYYLNLIKKIKKEIPKAKISTDVIVGFPGETEKDFGETKKVFEKVGFYLAYINKYSPRPETAAFKLGDPIPWNEKKRRERELRKLVK